MTKRTNSLGFVYEDVGGEVDKAIILLVMLVLGTTFGCLTVGDSARFNVSVVSTSSPVFEGDRIEITVRVENTGNGSGKKTISVTIPGVGSDSKSVSLGKGKSTNVNLYIETLRGHLGFYNASVQSDDDSDEEPVVVLTRESPSNMILGQNDLPSNYTLSRDETYASPEEISQQMAPNLATWRSWGFEEACIRTFESTVLGSTDQIVIHVYRFSLMDGARAVLDYRRDALQEDFWSDFRFPEMTETIGDESFALYWPESITWEEGYAVYFRRMNVYAYVEVSGGSLADAELHARVIESKINGE